MLTISFAIWCWIKKVRLSLSEVIMLGLPLVVIDLFLFMLWTLMR
jgi:hypothetical protein